MTYRNFMFPMPSNVAAIMASIAFGFGLMALANSSYPASGRGKHNRARVKHSDRRRKPARMRK
jgi:hypothetical protein